MRVSTSKPSRKHDHTAVEVAVNQRYRELRNLLATVRDEDLDGAPILELCQVYVKVRDQIARETGKSPEEFMDGMRRLFAPAETAKPAEVRRWVRLIAPGEWSLERRSFDGVWEATGTVATGEQYMPPLPS